MPQTPDRPGRPNILVIITDQQRADTLACDGTDWSQRPNMNALADSSFVFQNAYVTQPVCTPSRSSLLTGTYPHTNGLLRNGIPLAPGARSIAEMVSPEYRRVHYGKWHLGNDAEAQHGFQDWVSTGHVDPGPDGSRQSDYHARLDGPGVVLPEHHVRTGGDAAGSNGAVARANPPALTLLDGPFVGLDLDSREALADLLRERSAEGGTVVMASHDLDLLPQLADRIVFIHDARVVAGGSPDELLAAMPDVTRFEFTLDRPVDSAELVLGEGITLVDGGDPLVLESERGQAALPDACRALVAAGARIRGVAVRNVGLAAVFRSVTGAELDG